MSVKQDICYCSPHDFICGGICCYCYRPIHMERLKGVFTGNNAQFSPFYAAYKLNKEQVKEEVKERRDETGLISNEYSLKRRRIK